MSTIKEQLAADIENLKQFNRNIANFETVIINKITRVSDLDNRILNDLRDFVMASRELVNYVTEKIKEIRVVNVNMIESIAARIDRLEAQESTPNRQPLTPATPSARRIDQAQQRIGLPIVNNGLGNVINMNAVSSVAPQNTNSVEVVARPTTTNVAITSRPMNTQESSDHIVVRRPDGTSVILSSPESQTTRTQLISEGNIPVTRAALRDEQYENYDDDDEYEDNNDVEYLIDDTVTTLQAELENGVIVEAYCEECGEDIDVNVFSTLNKCPNCDRVVVGRSFVQA